MLSDSSCLFYLKCRMKSGGAEAFSIDLNKQLSLQCKTYTSALP